MSDGDTVELGAERIAKLAHQESTMSVTDDTDLDDAINEIGGGAHFFINTMFGDQGWKVADCLRFLRSKASLTDAELKPWKDQLSKLLRRRLITFASEKQGRQVFRRPKLNRARIVAIAKDQAQRHDDWHARNAGFPNAEAAQRFYDEHYN